MGGTSRPRPPEDGLPTKLVSPFPEGNALRWELPVKVNGLPGVLVIRCFTAAGKYRGGTPSAAGDGEMRAQGRAARFLEEGT